MGWTSELHTHRPAPVSLPTIDIADIDIEREAKEAAAKVAERRIVRQGLDAWREINRAESFEGWRAIGAALHVGKLHALKITQANAPWGRNYSREFSAWMKAHGFGEMRASDRSHAIELHENFAAITAWRASLPERERRRLIGAQANVKRWRKETRQGDRRRDDVARALAAWRHFRSCMQALPRYQAGEIWQAVATEAAAMR
jgi:hypothetical protein